MNRAAFCVLLMIFTLLYLSCHNRQDKYSSEENQVFLSWDTKPQKQPKVNLIEAEQRLPKGAFPWGGTVSHHLLAGELIDEWFLKLKQARDVDLFYVLSPSHWNLSIYDYSLTDGSWKTNNGLVLSDKTKVNKLAGILNTPLEHHVFKYEHGVSTLTPYIKKHFPEAKVVVIAYNGEPPIDMKKTEKLGRAMKKMFSPKTAKKQNAFLLVSTDFSHHGNFSKIAENDARTRKYLSSLNPDSWTLVICDNRPAIYLISKFSTENTKCTIQHATTAYELTDETDSADITSYFFTYFWEDE
ncbi:MAG: AmmeMemoRadiSam system protein B [Treponema sp.]|nr:MAG: AmmeMemoRadiSam system protein B [Treponema sp.]